jgi:hypothetical protein
VLIVGCKDKELQAQQIAENARKTTADSVTDATVPLVDEGYRFRMDWPGEGWKLLGPDEARRLVPDAVAGAVKLPGTFLVVIVERAPSTNVDDLVELVLSNNTMIADQNVERKETVRFAEQDARRLVWTGSVEGSRFRWVNTLFVHEGHGYQVLAWGPADSFQASDVEPACNGFSILPGEVVGPTIVAEADRSGPGWRQTSGVFESAVSGVRVQPPSGWRVVTGSALAVMNDEAEVGLEAPGLGGYLVLLPERIGTADAADFRSTMVAQVQKNLGSPPTGEWQATVAGQPVVFAEFQTAPLEFLLGTLVVDQVGIQLLAWYPIAARDAVRESLPRAVAGITTLDRSAREALRAQLEGSPDPQSHVATTHSLRGGVFREFEAKLVWRKPSGFWRLSAGDKPNTPLAESIEFENLESGLSGHLVVEQRPGIDPIAWHDERVQLQGGEAEERRTIELANGQAQITKVTLRNGSLRIELEVGTVVHGDYAIELLVLGHAERMAAASADVRKVFGGLELAGELPKIDVVHGEYIDQRLGFSLRPPADWRVVDETPADKASLGTFLLWKDGRRELRLLAMNWGGNATDSRFVTQLIEQGAREEMTKRLGAATITKTTLAGLSAEHTKWAGVLERADLVIASHNDSAFVFISVNLDDEQLGDVLGSFRVLE